MKVTIDASGSTDPDGTIVSYRFDFDDGESTIQPDPFTAHTFLNNNHWVWVTVTDDFGATNTAAAFVSVSQNIPPIVFVSADPRSADPRSGGAPVYVRLDASRSFDRDGTIVEFRFDFGDGIVRSQTQPVAYHTYYEAGDQVIVVTAIDDAGARQSASATVQVTAGPESDPGLMIPLLEQIWESRDAARYRELFTADFRFGFGASDPERSWGRDDELTSATQLFVGGGAEPPATGITLAMTGASPPGTLFIPGKPFPWHRQILVPSYALEVTRSDGSVLRAEGGSLFHLVRGDSALLPQELLDRGFTPDSSRWYIEGWEDVPDLTRVPDHPPIVTAPAGITGPVGSRIVFSVSAIDPNHQPLPALTVSPIPPGAIFVPSPYHPEGTFAWVPEISDVGTHELTIATSNSLPGSARTLVTVLPPLLLGPIAKLAATPSVGIQPLVVALDASGSIDPDGPIASYRFDFGDGTVVMGTNPVVSHTYWSGSWATVTVTGSDGDTASAGVDLRVAETNLAKNASFESDARGWIAEGGAALERIEGGHDGHHALRVTGPAVMQSHFGINDSPNMVSNTTAAGVRTRFTAWVRSPSAQGSAKLLIREYSNASGARLGEAFSVPVRLTPEWQMLAVDYVTKAPSSYLSAQVRDYPVAPLEVFLTDDIAMMVVAVEGSLPNLAHNPSFEVDAQGWTGEGGASLERIGGGHQSNYALQVTGPAVKNAHFGINDQPNMVYRTTSAGIRYRFSARVRSPSAQGRAKLLVREYPANGSTPLGELFSVPTPLTSQWQMLTLEYVTKAPNTTLSFQVRDYPVVASEVFLTDDIAVRVVGLESPQPNLAQNASFETDTQGWKADGDATLERIPGGHEGEYAIQVTGSGAMQAPFGINDSPNTVYRTIAAGTAYRATSWVRSPSAHGTTRLLIREYSMSTAALLGEANSDPVELAPDWQVLTLDYVTTAENTTLSLQIQNDPVEPSEVFLTDGIVVHNITSRSGESGMAQGPVWADEVTGFDPLLAPNPVRDQSWLRFATTEAGVLRVEVLDVAGRRVRRLLDESNAPAGVHELILTRMGDNGRRLGAGIFFYRIEAQQGVRTGRFVVLE